MKKTILSLAVLVALGTSGFAAGMMNGDGPQGTGNPSTMQGGGMQKGMHNGGMKGMPMLQSINLTDDQRHKLAVLQSEMKLEMTKLHDPKMTQKMKDFMTGETFDKKEFLRVTTENQAKMNIIKADHMEKVFNLLTKEQRAELKATMAKKQMPATGK